MGGSLERAKRIFERFHGVEAAEAIEITLDTQIPTKLVVIGKALAVEYEPLAGAKKGKRYRHEFGDTGGKQVKAVQYLCSDESGKRFFLVPENPRAQYPVLNERGIVG